MLIHSRMSFCRISKLLKQLILKGAVLRHSFAWLHNTPVLCIESLEGQTKMNTEIAKQSKQFYYKKLQQFNKRLDNNSQNVKSIGELDVSSNLINDELEKHEIFEKLKENSAMHEKCARSKYERQLADYQRMDRLIQAQYKALQDLRMESEELYQEAIRPDYTLLPIKIKGPSGTSVQSASNFNDISYILNKRN